MLPSLTIAARGRHVPLPRVLAAVALACLVLAGVALRREEPTGMATTTVASLATRLDRSSVALTMPIGWLSAPLAGLALDDRLDVVGVRPGDPSSVYPLAADARVLGQDERSLTVSLRPDDAAQLALARANGLLLVPLLRPRR